MSLLNALQGFFKRREDADDTEDNSPLDLDGRYRGEDEKEPIPTEEDEKKAETGDSSGSGRASGSGERVRNIALRAPLPVDLNSINDETSGFSFGYEGFKPDEALKFIDTVFSEWIQKLLAMSAVMVGRLTEKKLKNTLFFKQAKIVVEDGSKPAPNEIRKTMTLGDFLVKAFGGGRSLRNPGFKDPVNRDLGYSKIGTLMIQRWYRWLSAQTKFREHITAAEEVYSSSGQTFSFDIGACFPLNDEQMDYHIAIRCFRAIVVDGYVSGQIQVAVTQQNYVRRKENVPEYAYSTDRVMNVFNRICEKFGKKEMMNFPIERLSAEKVGAERNNDVTLTNSKNQALKDRAREIQQFVKATVQVKKTPPPPPP